ncbi:MAG: ABC-2 family transporter protein [Oscillospiraceae bacterium]|nr:ABC-2 family transporter protein [Oscillospiraceae bacterium]
MKKALNLFRIEGIFLKYNLIAMLQYRLSYFLSVFYELFDALTMMAYFYIVFGSTSSIAGWAQSQIFTLVVVSYFINIVCVMLYIGMTSIPEYIHSGQLDLLLLKPVNKRFFLTFRSPNSVQILNFLVAAVGIGYCVAKSDAVAINIICFFIALLCSIILMYSVMCILISLSFWFIRIGNSWNIIELLNQMSAKPKNIFPMPIQLLLTLFIPALVIINNPAYILHFQYDIFLRQTLPITVIFYISSVIVFRLGLKKYSSAGG